MKTYDIAVFTGDTSKPLQRILVPTKEFLQDFLAKQDPSKDCSALIRSYKDDDEDEDGENSLLIEKHVFFGTVSRLIKQEV
jgi:hypothetical protein